jgi:pyruvate dehydrogenase E1 component alpha subunit
VLCYFGDGASSKGDLHEAANFAGVYKAPVVLLCLNNQWAISVPRRLQTASATIAQKAVAYGFPGIQVDGQDVLAVYAVTRQALERARAGEGPTLIEAVTYRFGAHTTADDPKRYRDAAEVEFWQQRDPLVRFRRYLMASGLWSEAEEARLEEELQAEIAAAVAAVEAGPRPDPGAMFDLVFAEPTPQQRAQKARLAADLQEG